MTAVVVFFLISGFVLYRPYVEARFDGLRMPSLLRYAVRRTARIVPAYWVALVIVAIWFGMHYVFTARGALVYFGFLQLYGRPSTLAGGIAVAWTLCVEVTFYILLPALALIPRRIGRGRSVLHSELLLCLALALVSIAWQCLVFATTSATSGRRIELLLMLPGSLVLFAAGMALAAISAAVERGQVAGRTLEVIKRAPWLAWIAAFGILYGVQELGFLYRSGLAAWWLPTLQLKMLAAALLLTPLIFEVQANGWLRRALAVRPIVWLGTISYGIYLWHQPLLDKLAPHLMNDGELFTGVIVAAATIVVATLSYYVVERPVQRLAARWLQARGIRIASAPVAVAASAGPAHDRGP